MKKLLEGKVAVVAGATRGAGRGIAAALGEAGATVYCTGRSVPGSPGMKNRPETIILGPRRGIRDQRRRRHATSLRAVAPGEHAGGRGRLEEGGRRLLCLLGEDAVPGSRVRIIAPAHTRSRSAPGRRRAVDCKGARQCQALGKEPSMATKVAFEVGTALVAIRQAVKDLPRAAMFELAARGYRSVFQQL